MRSQDRQLFFLGKLGFFCLFFSGFVGKQKKKGKKITEKSKRKKKQKDTSTLTDHGN